MQHIAGQRGERLKRCLLITQMIAKTLFNLTKYSAVLNISIYLVSKLSLFAVIHLLQRILLYFYLKIYLYYNIQYKII